RRPSRRRARCDEGRAPRPGDRHPPARALAARPPGPASQRPRRCAPRDRDRRPPHRGAPPRLPRRRAAVGAQPAEVEEARSRVVQAGYEERRRLERDLHDGAQQRLVTLGIVLPRLPLSLPREAQMLVPALDAAVDEVAASIADLRTIAAGVRPPRLDEGLAAALA